MDHRSDLFSLGSVLYELATERAPFLAPSTLAVLNRVVKDDPRPIPEIAPHVPAWFDSIIQKLLAKNPVSGTSPRLRSLTSSANVSPNCIPLGE